MNSNLFILKPVKKHKPLNILCYGKIELLSEKRLARSMDYRIAKIHDLKDTRYILVIERWQS